MAGGAVAGGAVAGGAVAAGAGAGMAGVPELPWAIGAGAVVGGLVGWVVADGGALVVVDAGAAAADVETANHSPSTPWPAVSPAFVSPLNR